MPSTAAEEYQPTAVTSWTLAQLDRMAVIMIDFCRPTTKSSFVAPSRPSRSYRGRVDDHDPQQKHNLLTVCLD